MKLTNLIFLKVQKPFSEPFLNFFGYFPQNSIFFQNNQAVSLLRPYGSNFMHSI